MKLYTKTGDKGQTSLLGGRRVSKSIVRLEVIGCLDEANAHLGKIISKSEIRNSKQIGNSKSESTNDSQFSILNSQLIRIQGELFDLGADIATPYNASTSLQKSISRVTSKYTKRLEQEIDEFGRETKPLKNFILPGGHEIASELQIARSIVRRAERNLVRLQKGAKVNEHALQYLNRLSDWLFAAARYVNQLTETEETVWG